MRMMLTLVKTACFALVRKRLETYSSRPKTTAGYLKYYSKINHKRLFLLR